MNHSWALLVVLAIVLFNAGSTLADVLHVPSHHPTIQAAVDAAQHGDTVVVADGNWAGFICDKTITIRSKNGPAACIIEKTGPYPTAIVKLTGTSSPTVEGFTISPRPAFRSTLGLSIADGAQATVRECHISGFWGLLAPGAVQVAGEVRTRTSAAFIDCIIRDNGSGDPGIRAVTGGAMHIFQADVEMTRCIIEDNSTGEGVAITHGAATHDAGDGAGIAARSAQITLIDTIIRDNRAGHGGSDLGCDPFHQSGRGTNGGRGGGLFMVDSTALLINTVLARNTAGNGGIGGECPPREGGDGGDGGAIYIQGGALTLINSTIAENSAGSRGTGPAAEGQHGRGGGILADNATVEVHNSILWDNTAFDTDPYVAQISGAVHQQTHSCILGLPAGFDADGNFGFDPLFRFGNDSDYSLRPNSPCIDSGDNARVPAGITTDIAGHPRFHNDPQSVNIGAGTAPVVDVGAHEFQGTSCYADCNADGTLDILDFHCFIDRFTSGDPRANCDQRAQPPLLNINDLLCFTDRFVQGCP